jgi:hypothetical protein
MELRSRLTLRVTLHRHDRRGDRAASRKWRSERSVPVYPNQRHAVLRCPRSTASSALFARGERELPLLKALKGAIIAAKPLELRRMSVNENVPQQRWAAQRQGGSDGDTRLARGCILYDGRCNRARRGADYSTVVVAPTGGTSGSGPRQYAAATLPVSVYDRSWLSSYRAKSAGCVSRS